MDIQRQMAYWRDGALEDLEAAEVLLTKKKVRHGLFFAELAVEKMLKAHVVRQTHSVPPKTHDLLRLADLARIRLSRKQRLFLARFQEYCLEGRYPEHLPPTPSLREAKSMLRECREVHSWLINLFD